MQTENFLEDPLKVVTFTTEKMQVKKLSRGANNYSFGACRSDFRISGTPGQITRILGHISGISGNVRILRIQTDFKDFKDSWIFDQILGISGLMPRISRRM